LAYHQAEDPQDVQDVMIPRSQDAQMADERLKLVRTILADPLAPVDLPDAKLWKLVQYASKFFILVGRLMRRDVQARHKVVIPQEKRFRIISQAHDAVGHKAIFVTQSNLRQRFWWPMLEQDVKWFVSTCHPCQT